MYLVSESVYSYTTLLNYLLVFTYSHSNDETAFITRFQKVEPRENFIIVRQGICFSEKLM